MCPFNLPWQALAICQDKIEESRFEYHLRRERLLQKLVKYIIVFVSLRDSFCPMQQKTIPVDKYEESAHHRLSFSVTLLALIHAMNGKQSFDLHDLSKSFKLHNSFVSTKNLSFVKSKLMKKFLINLHMLRFYQCILLSEEWKVS